MVPKGIESGEEDDTKISTNMYINNTRERIE